MDWSCPTAIVVGNEGSGISEEALELSDLHCSIPMNGMVDSFNVSVAAGILMHHAVSDRITRLVKPISIHSYIICIPAFHLCLYNTCVFPQTGKPWRSVGRRERDIDG